MKIKHNYLLTVCVAVLALLCVLSVSSPVRFRREQQRREQEVKRCLVAIRRAEALYRQAHGSYTADFGALIAEKMLADSLQYIPYSGGKRFRLGVAEQTGKSGRRIPLMECSALYADYLRGLDAAQVANLAEEAGAEGRFAGLKIGDLTTPNDHAGNWE